MHGNLSAALIRPPQGAPNHSTGTEGGLGGRLSPTAFRVGEKPNLSPIALIFADITSVSLGWPPPDMAGWTPFQVSNPALSCGFLRSPTWKLEGGSKRSGRGMGSSK